MHRLLKDGISPEEIDFPWGANPSADVILNHLISDINSLISAYKDVEDEYKDQFFAMIKALLPEGYMQTRMVSLNYQVLRTMYNQRKNHRLPHWNTDFVNWIHTLPMSEWITGDFPEEEKEIEKELTEEKENNETDSSIGEQLEINFEEGQESEKTVDEQ